MIKVKMENKVDIKTDRDVLKARKIIHELTKELGFNLVNQTKIVTAVSELTRNVRLYAEKGILYYEVIEGEDYPGLKICVEDEGPGIENVELAMMDGYSTSKGLGKGLSGTKKLMDEFKIESSIGEGTKLEVIKWLKERISS